MKVLQIDATRLKQLHENEVEYQALHSYQLERIRHQMAGANSPI